MDGLVTLLNNQLAAAGEERRFTVTSRVVKKVYDRVHEAYDGKWDAAEGKYVNPRTTFFQPEELLEMAREFERGGAA